MPCCVRDVDLFYLFCSFPFFDFDLDVVCFSSCLTRFFVGTIMLSPRCRFRLRLVWHTSTMICILIRTYADLTLFLSEVYDLFQLQSLCVLSPAFYQVFVFLLRGNFPL